MGTQGPALSPRLGPVDGRALKADTPPKLWTVGHTALGPPTASVEGAGCKQTNENWFPENWEIDWFLHCLIRWKWGMMQWNRRGSGHATAPSYWSGHYNGAQHYAAVHCTLHSTKLQNETGESWAIIENSVWPGQLTQPSGIQNLELVWRKKTWMWKLVGLIENCNLW